MRAVRRNARKRSGAAAVEMAMVLPVFVLIVLGVIEFARFGMAVQLLTTAAREGCRTASLPNTAQSDVTERITEVLSGSGIPAPTPTLTPSNWTTAAQGEPISLTLSVPYQDISWLSGAGILSGNVTASATFGSEKP
ncbi:MAG TPA: TadE/TadG family type IV pilus assembly protein [Isosphaeraceae bacterium]|nr:TadE/TadG family type IV pilus assembly protein [Isosphaeraceae bacterium]